MDTPKSEHNPEAPRAYHGTAGTFGMDGLHRLVPLDPRDRMQAFFASSQADLRRVRLDAFGLAASMHAQGLSASGKADATVTDSAREIIALVEEI